MPWRRLWKFLKDRTRQFAHLHKVFTNIPSNTPQCGTAAWTQIFLHYPLAGAVLAHQLLARGLKACLKFKDDSSAAGCAYIESVNTSVSQLGNLPHLSVPEQVLFDAGLQTPWALCSTVCVIAYSAHTVCTPWALIFELDQVPLASCTVRAQPAFDFADKADLGIARLYPLGMSLGPFCAHPSPPLIPSTLLSAFGSRSRMAFAKTISSL
jgi:hypothetical protein